MPAHCFEFPESLSTLVEILQWRVVEHGSRPAFTFLVDGDPTGTLSFAALDARARAIAAFLQDRKYSGQPALVCHPPGLDYVAAFVGCLYAGVLAIPLYPPRNRRHVGRLEAVVRNSGAPVVLTSTDDVSDLSEWLGAGERGSRIAVVGTDAIDTSRGELWRPIAAQPHDLAYLQYTSGSTATPKGVMVSHENVLRNGDAIREGFGFFPEGITVSWLPLFHDMGLLLTVIVPLLAGNPVYMMTPAAFVQRPFRWLDAMGKYRATHSGGPNFAFDLCVGRITGAQLDQLDLSTWVSAYTGAEPVRSATLARFSRTFAGAGFSPRAYVPAYGLAEATLVVSSQRPGGEIHSLGVQAEALARHRLVVTPDQTRAIDVTSCGPLALDTQVEIVNPDTRRRCAPDEIGEIWSKGPGNALGYWRNDEATEQTFRATLADTGDGPFLRTGDLGILRGGELYITGRIKEVIILRGRNHYPHDIELTLQDGDPALERGAGAAFGVDVDGEERLVIVQEVSRTALRTLDAPAVLQRLREAVVATHEVDIYDLVLLSPLDVPKTSSGKIQRGEAKARYLAGEFNVVARHKQGAGVPEGQGAEAPCAKVPSATVPSVPLASITVPRADIRLWLITRLSEWRSIPPGEIDDRRPFESFGIDSMLAVRLSGELEEYLGVALPATLLYDHPSIAALTEHVAGLKSRATDNVSVARDFSPAVTEPIAIIGMGCRFPGADGPAAFWHLLQSGTDAISRTRFSANGGYLSNVDAFDADFFGISPREAVDLDPQQRLLLEVAWHALEDAGVAPDRLAGTSTGVFVGVSTRDYADLVAAAEPARLSPYFGTGTAASAAAGRLSYVLGLEGPSLVTDTACSSSLVSVHLAVQSLRARECDLALTGGVNLILSSELTSALGQARMLSPDGRCKTFDTSADGYVRGEGCGVVVLERLADAIADGHRVLAVIRGTAVNQDGRTNGLTAPSGRAQERVVHAALAAAGADASEIGYVEAHGTGTSLGDPIEVHALARVFGPRQDGRAPAWLGSVKTNIGHLEAAAGIAGLIKVVLSLQHRAIAPHLHLREPSPLIAWDTVPFAVPRTLSPWPADRPRLLAGVSSFGFVGTNCHAIVSEAPARAIEVESGDRAGHVLCLSARSETALAALAREYATWLGHDTSAFNLRPSAPIRDICCTAATGRTHFRHRLAVAGETLSDLRASLDASSSGRKATRAFRGERAVAADPGPVFVFTGQGSQYPRMGRDLYESHPVFRRAMDECEALLRPHLECPLLSVLYEDEARAPLVDRTEYSQPALFALEWALVETWRSMGVSPAAVIGHSIGEYVAACVAGVIPLADALTLVAVRGRAMQRLPDGGAMTAVFAGERTAGEAMAAERVGVVSIAAVNGPAQCVISGEAVAVARVAARLEAAGVTCEPLRVSHAFHSPLMTPSLDEWLHAFDRVALSAPRILVISNQTGREADPAEIVQPDYWRRHALEPVRFGDGIGTLLANGFRTFLEIGPHPTLSALARTLKSRSSATWMTSLRRRREDRAQMLDAVAALYAAGVDIDWARYYAGEQRSVVSLPVYPFERQRFWPFDPADLAQGRPGPAKTRSVARAADDDPVLGTRVEVAGQIAEVWTRQISRREDDWLRDHRVEGAVVYPGTAYIEAGLAAAGRVVGAGAGLTNLRFERALVLDADEVVELQTQIAPANRGFEIAIYSRRAAGAWTRHAVFGATRAEGRTPRPAPTREGAINTIAPADFYQSWAARGNQWGPRFQGIAELWSGAGEARARLLPPAALGDIGDHRVHPAILDAAVQVLAAAVAHPPRAAFVGKSVDTVRVYQPLAGALWSHASLARAPGKHGDVEGDVTVVDDRGELVAELVGVRFAFLDAAASRVSPERWLHAVEWIPAPRSGGSPRAAGDTWVMADEDTAASALEQVLSRVRATTREPASGPLTLVTRDVWTLAALNERQRVEGAGDRGAASPVGATVWGLGRTLAVEHRELGVRLIDIDGRTGTDSAEAIAELLASCDPSEDQIAIRDGQVFVPRLRPLSVPAGPPPRFPTDASYLITGGLGALGLHVARWMIERGCRRLILMSRSASTRTPAVQQLEAMGAEIHLARVDVSDRSALSKWIASFHGEGRPPIRGVVHAAGVVEEIAAVALTPDALSAQLGAKVNGARALDEIFGTDDSLDWFFLFSSASALVGSPGLGAYAAANAFLDALAESRRARGLPATSIAWGPWSGGGMTDQRGREGYEGREGREGARRHEGVGAVQEIDPEHGLAILEQLWHSPRANVAVLPFDWPRWSAQYGTAAATPFLSDVLAPPVERTRERVDRDQLLALDADARRARLTAWLTRHVAAVLRLPEESVEPDRPLGSLGLDSLMAVEIRNRVQDDLQVSVPLVELLRGGDIHYIVSLVDARLADGVTVRRFEPVPAGELETRAWPLSHGQRAMWLLQALDPESASYHVAFTARVTSEVDRDALGAAWQTLRTRHAMLRTAWLRDGDEPQGDEILQRVRATATSSFEAHTVSPEDEAALDEQVLAAYRRPFDLESGAPARLHLFSASPTNHVLLLVAHHIACDGWSLWVLIDELKTAYAAARDRSTPVLPPLQASYIDFVRAEAERLQGPDGARQWAYWRERLAGELPVLDLPADHPRPPVQSSRGASHPFALSGDLTRDLRALAQQHGVTLVTVLTAAFNTLLHRLTGQDDILVGLPTSGRADGHFGGVVGHCVNQVVLRSDLTGDPPFDALLARTRDAILAALANQDLPFPLLVERLRPERHAGRSPIVQVNLVYQQAQQAGEVVELFTHDGQGGALRLGSTRSGQAIPWGGLELRAYPLFQQEGQFDLTVELAEAGDRLTGILKYREDLFESSTIARLAGHFTELLRSAVAAPDCRISALPVLTGSERICRLEEWCGGTAAWPTSSTLAELFTRVARDTPDRVALVFEGEKMTYGELNLRANRLAHRLQRLGVGPDVLVALLFAPGLEMIVALLAALKAGGGYLPLDPQHPRERLAFMLEDSAAPVLVSSDALVERAAGFRGHVVRSEVDRDAMAAEPDQDPVSAARPGNIAYCIYTSGTTGKPKGVLIEHRQVTRLFDATREWFAFGAGDTWTLLHSYAFDFSVWEIWGALLHGGRLLCVPSMIARAPDALHRLICDEGVTVLNTTPSAFRELIAADADAAASVTPASLRLVIFGGEALDAAMLRPWIDRHGDRPALVNMYGITETTVHVTYTPVDHVDAPGPSRIGVPIPDVQMYLLDRRMELLPVGVPGEIYVGGAGLARGYLGRPDLTADRFVPHPFSTEPGARLYRSGDRGRHRADGTVEYLGRIDRQVKVRGFRIERGEIESALLAHPAVSGAVVLAREGAGATTALTAYVVLQSEQSSHEDLRAHLRASLPEYMVPSSVVVVDAFPLTANGKVDERRLASIEPAPRHRDVAAVAAPSTETEHAVANVWREVLGVDAVGLHDNFFDLGGHSLLVPHVHRRLKQLVDNHLTIVDLFRYPTVAALAAHLGGRRSRLDTLDASVTRAALRSARRSQRVPPPKGTASPGRGDRTGA